jgi:hypothetical protein
MSVAERGWVATNPAGQQVAVVALRYFVAVLLRACDGTDRTRTVSLGNLPPPVVRAPGTFYHVVSLDLC